MEGKEDLQISGIMKGEEVPDTYRLAPRNENPIQFSESTTPVTPPVVPIASPVAAETPPVPAVAPPVVAPPTMAASPATPLGGVTTGTEGKKKRGRPRKYGPDGKPTFALSPMPISASIPLTGDYNTWTPSRGRPTEYKKKHKLEFASLSSGVAYSVGANFTPHVISVNAGEDVSMKIISFSQQGSRAICILAANGTISNVTLRQPNSSGGTLTYEGRFEILSLSGSFMPTDSGGTKSRTGGMSVSLAGPDGRVLGGGLAGLLIAAGPVQVVIGSFLAGHQQEQKPKKQKFDFTAPFSPVPASANHHIFGDGAHQVFSGPQVTQPSLPPASQPSLTSASQPSLTPASYHGNNLDSGNAVHGPKILGQENNLSLSGESKDLSPSKCMVSC